MVSYYVWLISILGWLEHLDVEVLLQVSKQRGYY